MRYTGWTVADLTAEQVLQLINDDEPVDLSSLRLCVITEGSKRAFDGRRFVDAVLPGWGPFFPGEILLVDRVTDREVFGRGRDVTDWGVTVVYPESLDEARRLSAEAKARAGESRG